MELRCAQKGCTFEADETPELCPVCNNPFIESDADEELAWTDYTLPELREQATEWGLEGWNTSTSKPDLIELLEVAEAADAELDDD